MKSERNSAKEFLHNMETENLDEIKISKVSRIEKTEIGMKITFDDGFSVKLMRIKRLDIYVAPMKNGKHKVFSKASNSTLKDLVVSWCTAENVVELILLLYPVYELLFRSAEAPLQCEDMNE